MGRIKVPGASRCESILSYLPAAGSYPRVSQSEYVLYSETTGNIGVTRLDAIRAAKGKGLAAGGIVSGAPTLTSGGAPGGDTIVNVTIHEDRTATVEIDSPLLEKKIIKTVRANITSNPADIPGDLQLALQKAGVIRK